VLRPAKNIARTSGAIFTTLNGPCPCAETQRSACQAQTTSPAGDENAAFASTVHLVLFFTENDSQAPRGILADGDLFALSVQRLIWNTSTARKT